MYTKRIQQTFFYYIQFIGISVSELTISHGKMIALQPVTKFIKIYTLFFSDFPNIQCLEIPYLFPMMSGSTLKINLVFQRAHVLTLNISSLPLQGGIH